jgi:tryptophanase
MNNIIEPFRIKTVEPLKLTTIEERKEILKNAYYDVTRLKSEDIIIDLLTDSGVAAMSSYQWAAIQLGDESYIGSSSYYNFQDAVRKYLPFKHIIPTHQGRAADRILACIFAENDKIIPSNSHFITIKENIEFLNCHACELVIEESNDHESIHPFKGNIDVKKLTKLLESEQENIPLVMLMITNNSIAGQPVSMENIRKTSEICKKYNKPLFIDGCRYAENAYFIKQREQGYANSNIHSIVKEMFSYTDGMTMSAKKDGMVNIGGWIALNSDILATKAIDILLMTEGFITYGGLSGRDLNAMAVGIGEGMDENYLRYRIGQIEYLGNALDQIGIPVYKPFGGHAVFIDAHKFLQHLSKESNPEQTLLAALFLHGGIRASVTNSIHLDTKRNKTKNTNQSFVRLSIPRRVYTQNHLDYIVEVFQKIKTNKETLSGLKMVNPPSALQNYSAVYSEIDK